MAQSVEVISHWHQSVEGLSTSTLDFYAAVEKALREKEVVDLRIERIEVPEHGILSAQRAYLGVSYGRLRFDICGAPFGKDFFFSWWLVKRTPGFAALWGCATTLGLLQIVLVAGATTGYFRSFFYALVAIVVAGTLLRSNAADRWNVVEDTILATPVIGLLYTKFVKPVTYYSEDTRLMFEDTIHRVVLDVVSGILTLNKLPQIPTEKLKPQSRKAIA
ncbi:MAG: hypothetical protein ACYC1I_12910 [Acidimicrobiales bacterium]